MKYTNLKTSRFLKFDCPLATEGIKPSKYWVNSYQEGRRDEMVSTWELLEEKPTDNRTRYYPAYSEEVFIKKIVPRLLA